MVLKWHKNQVCRLDSFTGYKLKLFIVVWKDYQFNPVRCGGGKMGFYSIRFQYNRFPTKRYLETFVWFLIEAKLKKNVYQIWWSFSRLIRVKVHITPPIRHLGLMFDVVVRGCVKQSHRFTEMKSEIDEY